MMMMMMTSAISPSDSTQFETKNKTKPKKFVFFFTKKTQPKKSLLPWRQYSTQFLPFFFQITDYDLRHKISSPDTLIVFIGMSVYLYSSVHVCPLTIMDSGLMECFLPIKVTESNQDTEPPFFNCFSSLSRLEPQFLVRIKEEGEAMELLTYELNYLYSVILTEYVAIEPRVCVYVSVCVCVCVCVISTA